MKKQSLDEILDEIGRSSLLTIDEETALCKAVQEKGTDCDEMKQLEKANMRYVVSVANQYQKRGLTLEKLIEAGNEGLKKAAMKYDASRGFKFIAYAVWWIRQSIIQALEENKNNCTTMDARIESLMKSLERNHHRYKETCIDEDTGEEVTVDRDEIIAVDTTKEERELMESIVADVANLSEEDLEAFRANTIWFWPRHFDEFYLELIRRGYEEQAIFIEDPAKLQELCDKGNKYAAYELYHKCRWGDEENGIFINKREAKHYFDLAGDVPQQYEEEWDDVDDPGEECPEDFCYTLTGNAQTLDAVETLINDLCKQFGTPGNEMGLFVPQQMLMKMLVGSDSIYYRGNVLSMERQAPDTLVITTEADNGEPLLYALRQAFSNLVVEMENEE